MDDHYSVNISKDMKFTEQEDFIIKMFMCK